MMDHCKPAEKRVALTGEDCPACDGSGRDKDNGECTRCAGRGRILVASARLVDRAKCRKCGKPDCAAGRHDPGKSFVLRNLPQVY